jgi:hypothetical protein
LEINKKEKKVPNPAPGQHIQAYLTTVGGEALHGRGKNVRGKL